MVPSLTSFVWGVTGRFCWGCTCPSMQPVRPAPSPDGLLLLQTCTPSCLLLRTDVYLPHPPLLRGGLGPCRWLIWPILHVFWRLSSVIMSGVRWTSVASSSFHILLKQSFEKQNHKLCCSSEEICLSDIISMRTDYGCPTLVHSRYRLSCHEGPC